MNKVIKLVYVLLVVMMLTTTFSTVCLAEKITPGQISDTAEGASLGDLKGTTEKVLGTIRNIAAVASVIIIAISNLFLTSTTYNVFLL